MTENEKRMLYYLTLCLTWTSPTAIARAIRGDAYHSSWASPILKRMEKKGWVVANERRHYGITGEGRDALRGELTE